MAVPPWQCPPAGWTALRGGVSPGRCRCAAGSCDLSVLPLRLPELGWAGLPGCPRHSPAAWSSSPDTTGLDKRDPGTPAPGSRQAASITSDLGRSTGAALCWSVRQGDTDHPCSARAIEQDTELLAKWPAAQAGFRCFFSHHAT